MHLISTVANWFFQCKDLNLSCMNINNMLNDFENVNYTYHLFRSTYQVTYYYYFTITGKYGLYVIFDFK